MTHPSVMALMRVLPVPPVDTEGKYQVQSPPPLPDSGGDRFDWDHIAARTGWRYPADFRSFLETYGAEGSINEHQLHIVSPPPAGVWYPHEPEPPFAAPADGLHPWGHDDGGDGFYWRSTDPDPDRWTVAVRLRDPWDWEAENHWLDFPLGMVDFLTGLLGGTLDVDLAVNVHGSKPHTYDSWRVLDLEVRAHYPTYTGRWVPIDGAA